MFTCTLETFFQTAALSYIAGFASVFALFFIADKVQKRKK